MSVPVSSFKQYHHMDIFKSKLHKSLRGQEVKQGNNNHMYTQRIRSKHKTHQTIIQYFLPP